MEKIVIISGSPSKTTRLKGIIDYATHFLSEKGIVPQQLHVIDLPAEDLILAKYNSEAIIAANAIIEEADAVIVASQVYKSSFTGTLKTYLDLLPQNGLENKIVLPLMLGGTFSHLLAIDYGLKPVLSSLGAENIIKGVFTLDTSVELSDDGKSVIQQEAKDRLDKAFSKFVIEIKKQQALV